MAPPKITNLDITVLNGRVQGLLSPGERLTNHTTERNSSAFSRRPQGLKASELDAGPSTRDAEEQPDILLSLGGQAKIRGVGVSLERLTFRIPGASVDQNGIFNLSDRTVHLLGNLHMQSDISHVTTGFKSLLMKPLILFFKKDNSGAVIPIEICGSPHRYKLPRIFNITNNDQEECLGRRDEAYRLFLTDDFPRSNQCQR